MNRVHEAAPPRVYFFVNSVLYKKLHFLYIKASGRMRIRISGKEAAHDYSQWREQNVEKPVSVTEYLKACNYIPVQVVVELNEEIIKRENYDTTVLKDGDVVEILHFMGGGSF